MDSKAAGDRVNINGVNTAASAGEKNESTEKSIQKLGGKVISADLLIVSTHNWLPV